MATDANRGDDRPRGHERRARLMLAACACAPLLIAAGCSGGDAPEAPAPGAPHFGGLDPGVALTVGGHPITEEEIERGADALEYFFGHESPAHRVRRAAVDHALPRAANAARATDARAAALVEAEALVDALARGDEVARAGLTRWHGPAFELDLWVWEALRDAPVGAVIGPVEDATGSFHVAVVERPFDPNGAADQDLTFSGLNLSYDQRPVLPLLDVVRGLEVRFAAARWRALLPTGVLHAMIEPGTEVGTERKP